VEREKISTRRVYNLEMAVLAKIRDGDFYPDLLSEGFASGPLIPCRKCDCEYRVFYGPDEMPASVAMESEGIPSFDEAVVQSHPQHTKKRIRVASPD
jgi:hypothetical protein